MPGHRRKPDVGFAPRSAHARDATLRAALVAQGWQPGSDLTVISDGAPALRNPAKPATGEPVTHILDWWHLSSRGRHIEQTIVGMMALQKPAHPTINFAALEANRPRNLLLNGYAEEAWQHCTAFRVGQVEYLSLQDRFTRCAPKNFRIIAAI